MTRSEEKWKRGEGEGGRKNIVPNQSPLAPILPPLTKPQKEQGQQEGRTIIALHHHKTVAPFT